MPSLTGPLQCAPVAGAFSLCAASFDASIRALSCHFYCNFNVGSRAVRFFSRPAESVVSATTTKGLCVSRMLMLGPT